jgi:hypothetical protein
VPSVNIMAVDTFVARGVSIDLCCVRIIFEEVIHGSVGWGVTVFGFI